MITPTFPDVQQVPLVCPADGQPLVNCADELACGTLHIYKIRNGIPRLVYESSYADAFGEQWNKYRRTQLDSFTGTTVTRDRLARCLGTELWKRLHDTRPVQVLEPGCGAGRFSEVLLSTPAAVVTSTDLSSAVDACQLNCPQTDRHRIVQCDIYKLPFPSKSYDVVLCLGVIQHTPDPEATIAALYAQVKPGGWLVFDHYTPTLSRYTKIGMLVLRPILKRLPPERGLAVTDGMTRVLFPLHRAVKRARPLQMLLSRISPLVTYYSTYPTLNDQQQFEWATLDTHDALTDYYKHLRTPGQLRRTLQDIGATDICVERGGNGVEARCRRPG